jgi:ABC-type polysaccharide/polyol phosphate export permease
MIFSQILRIGFSDKLAPHGPDGTAWRTTFYLVTGILPWSCLADSVGRGTGIVLENANLIKKIAFPSELLPLHMVIVFHIYFLIGFVILLGLQLFVNGTLPLALAWFPAVLLVQMMLITSLTFFFSAINVFIRDVMQAVPMLLMAWMFTTPVFYDVERLHTDATNAYAMAQNELRLATEAGAEAEAWVIVAQDAMTNAQETIVKADFAMNAMRFNPMAGILKLYRSIFSYGMVPFPVETLLIWGGISLLMLYLSYAYFLRCKGRFADEV